MVSGEIKLQSILMTASVVGRVAGQPFTASAAIILTFKTFTTPNNYSPPTLQNVGEPITGAAMILTLKSSSLNFLIEQRSPPPSL